MVSRHPTGVSGPPGRFRRRSAPGLALVVSIMTAFILMALLVSLFMVVATTGKQADYSRNAAVALNLAEAGIAEAVYRINYGPPAGAYPLTDTASPYADGSWLVHDDDPWPPRLGGLGAPPLPWLYGELNDGQYYVGLAAGEPGRLVAAGQYNGVWRLLSVDLRGLATAGDPRAGLGIAEAFNKKAVYAGEFWNSSVHTIAIDGNITTADESMLHTDNVSGQYTFSSPPPGGFAVPRLALHPGFTDTVQADTLVIFRDDPSDPDNYQPLDDQLHAHVDDFPGISYQGNDQYTLTGGGAAGETWRFEGNTPPLVTVAAGAVIDSALEVRSGGGIEVKTGAQTGPLAAAGAVSVEALSGATTRVGGRLRGAQITLDAQSATAAILVAGSLGADEAIIVSGEGAVTVDAAADTAARAALQAGRPDAAAMIYLQASTAPLAIILGDHQWAALLAVAGGEDVEVRVARSLDVNYARASQAAIVAEANTGDVLVAISGSTTRVPYVADPAAAPDGRGRLIYVGSPGGAARIELGADLTSPLVHGVLVTGGVLDFQRGRLVYDPAPFLAAVDGEVYDNFDGGRRAFVVRPGSWRLH